MIEILGQRPASDIGRRPLVSPKRLPGQKTRHARRISDCRADRPANRLHTLSRICDAVIRQLELQTDLRCGAATCATVPCQHRVVAMEGTGGSEDQSWKRQAYLPFAPSALLGTRAARVGREMDERSSDGRIRMSLARRVSRTASHLYSAIRPDRSRLGHIHRL